MAPKAEAGRLSVWMSGAEVKKVETLCAFALKLPKMRKANATKDQNTRVRQRHAIMKVIDHMMKKPSSGPDLWGQIDGGLLEGPSPTKPDEVGDDTHEQVDLTFHDKTVLKVHKDVKAGQLSALEGGPSQELLDKIDDKDGYAIADMFAFAFQYLKKDKFASNMSEIEAWTLMNKKEAQQ